jgi:tyrosine-protein kinase Etk/Wzc
MLTSDPPPLPGPAAEQRDLLDVRQLWQTIRQRYWLVAGVGVAVFLAVMTATLVSRMQFRSVARLYLGELESLSGNGAGRAQDELELSAANQGVVGSEIEIIQSRSLVSRAVLDSGLNVSIVQRDQGQPRYWKWLLARRDPGLLDRAGQELRAEGSRLTDERALERAYTLRFSSEKDYEVRDEAQLRLASCALGEACKVPGAELRLVRGSARAPSAGAEYAVVVRPLLEVVDAALKSLQVTSPKPTPQSPPVNVVALEFSSSSPAQAAGFLERLIAAYLAERQSWKVEDAGAAEAFVSSQLASVRKSLDDIQQKLATYRSNNRVVVLDNEAKAMIEQIGKYEEQRVAARLETAALSDVQRTLKGPNPPVGAFLLGEAKDTVLEDMAGALSTARQKLTDLESRFNDAAPEIRDQRSQVEAQLESIRNYVSSRAARARENLGTLDGVIAQYEKRLQTVPGAELGLAQLSRESEVYSRTYSYLLERQQQTAIIKASTLSKNRVLDAPQLPHREDSPKLLLRLASAPLGLLVGVLLVLGRSRFAGTLQSEGDAKSLLGGVGVLGAIPRRLRRRGARQAERDSDLDVIGDDTGSRFVEAFRTVRAKLYRSCKFGGQALLITSPTDRDGKTTCALGLAALLAADGKRVMVIDTDLRKPGTTQGAADDAMGLCAVLRGEAEWTSTLELVASRLGQFYFMPAGGPAPAELLSSKAMSDLLDEARKRCDFVVLDAPTFPAVSDALVLSALVDVVVSVLRPGQTQRKAAMEHLLALRSSSPVYTVVLNDVGFAPATKPQRTGATQPFATPVAARLLPRGRTLALWIGALLLLTAGVAARFSPLTTQVIESVVSLRHAG